MIVPIWVQVTGRSTWPHEELGTGKMVSKISEWLDLVLGDEAPTNDQVIRMLAMLRATPAPGTD
jgi:hypothetical protein